MLFSGNYQLERSQGVLCSEFLIRNHLLFKNALWEMLYNSITRDCLILEHSGDKESRQKQKKRFAPHCTFPSVCSECTERFCIFHTINLNTDRNIHKIFPSSFWLDYYSILQPQLCCTQTEYAHTCTWQVLWALLALLLLLKSSCYLLHSTLVIGVSEVPASCSMDPVCPLRNTAGICIFAERQMKVSVPVYAWLNIWLNSVPE